MNNNVDDSNVVTKCTIVARLLQNNQITAEEAVELLRTEVRVVKEVLPSPMPYTYGKQYPWQNPLPQTPYYFSYPDNNPDKYKITCGNNNGNMSMAFDADSKESINYEKTNNINTNTK